MHPLRKRGHPKFLSFCGIKGLVTQVPCVILSTLHVGFFSSAKVGPTHHDACPHVQGEHFDEGFLTLVVKRIDDCTCTSTERGMSCKKNSPSFNVLLLKRKAGGQIGDYQLKLRDVAKVLLYPLLMYYYCSCDSVITFVWRNACRFLVAANTRETRRINSTLKHDRCV